MSSSQNQKKPLCVCVCIKRIIYLSLFFPLPRSFSRANFISIHFYRWLKGFTSGLPPIRFWYWWWEEEEEEKRDLKEDEKISTGKSQIIDENIWYLTVVYFCHITPIRDLAIDFGFLCYIFVTVQIQNLHGIVTRTSGVGRTSRLSRFSLKLVRKRELGETEKKSPCST